MPAEIDGDSAIDLSISPPMIGPLPRFDANLSVGIRNARLIHDRPWIRILDRLSLSVTTEGWKFPAPPGDAADAGSLIWAFGLLAMMGVFAWLIGREIDEIGRRIVVNAIAVAGVTSLVLLLLAQAAGKLLPIAQPMHAIWMTAMLTIPAAIVFQRFRG